MRAQLLPLADSPVDGVHAGCPDRYADLAGTGVGFVGVDELKDFGTAELGEDHFSHGVERSTNG
jgi:hypothetical protein